MIQKTIILLLVIIAAGFFTACSEWTETESLPIETKSISELNSALYQEYLDNLRNYKNSNHPILLGWFDNSNKTFVSRVMHIADVPDKTDVISLLSPDNLSNIELEEMQELREKATKVIYTIDCHQFRRDVDAQNLEITEQNTAGAEEAALNGTPFTPTPLIVFTEVLPAFLDQQLALLDKFKYDGFSIHYIGKTSAFLTNEAKAEMQDVQNTIVSKVTSVISQNAGKLFIFEGTPEYMLNKEFLTLFDYIMIRTHTKIAITDVIQTVLLATVPGVPTDRLLVSASSVFVDDTDTALGSILGADGEPTNAILETARWIETPDSAFKKAGMGVWYINKDYYYPDQPYKNVQDAIDIMNPSAK
jgi:uncharacterized protein (UPF0333 family)